MAYNERIKNFDRIRDYMRDFFIYGYKTRTDFDKKSLRTYDNERRRIEGYLGDSIRWDYGRNGKNIFISADASALQHNPLHKAYKAKSFTDNDILLHFFLLDILKTMPDLSVEQLAERISLDYGVSFDPQTVRLKCKEYVEAGLLIVHKTGKRHTYAPAPWHWKDLKKSGEYFSEMLSFFSETAPFSEIGSFLSDGDETDASPFYFKHHFFGYTLDDIVLLTAVQAIEQHRMIDFVTVSGHSGEPVALHGYPLKVYVSTQTGRQYLIVKGIGRRRYTPCRLDYIRKIKLAEICKDTAEIITDFEQRRPLGFGIAISAERPTEHLSMTLRIDERTEQHVLHRLEREGKGGTVERLDNNLFRYSIDVYDTNEMMRWVKTFTGRIVKLEGSNSGIIRRFYNDMARMATLY